MPTPIATSTACQQLGQNSDWGEVPTDEVPDWAITTESKGYGVFYEVNDFGGDAFWTKWQDNYPPDPSYEVQINIAQAFSRCVGVPYQLSVAYYIHGYYDDRYPNQLPITFQVHVGLGGATPSAARKIVYSNPTYGSVGDYGVLLMLLPPLSAPPAAGTDGVSITLSDSFGGQMEMILHNVTVTAVSN